jgi:hypothetical protein
VQTAQQVCAIMHLCEWHLPCLTVQFGAPVFRSPAAVLNRNELQGEDCSSRAVRTVERNMYRRSDGKVPVDGSFDGRLVAFPPRGKDLCRRFGGTNCLLLQGD